MMLMKDIIGQRKEFLVRKLQSRYSVQVNGSILQMKMEIGDSLPVGCKCPVTYRIGLSERVEGKRLSWY